MFLNRSGGCCGWRAAVRQAGAGGNSNGGNAYSSGSRMYWAIPGGTAGEKDGDSRNSGPIPKGNSCVPDRKETGRSEGRRHLLMSPGARALAAESPVGRSGGGAQQP